MHLFSIFLDEDIVLVKIFFHGIPASEIPAPGTCAAVRISIVSVYSRRCPVLQVLLIDMSLCFYGVSAVRHMQSIY